MRAHINVLLLYLKILFYWRITLWLLQLGRYVINAHQFAAFGNSVVYSHRYAGTPLEL